MTEFFRDLRFGWRFLAKCPAFTTTAVLLLAVGIGATTAMFSLLDAWMLRALPVAHPETLARLIEVHPTQFVTYDFPYGVCATRLPKSASVSELICAGEADLPIREGTSVERVRVHFVSPNFFRSLGVAAAAGRVLSEEDEKAAARNAVLSHDFWARRFRLDRAIIGRTVVIAGEAFTVVGVTPEGFNGLSVDTSPDVRIPASCDRSLVVRTSEMANDARPLSGQIFARVRNGVSFDTASGEAEALLRARYRSESERIFPSLESRETVASRLRLEPIRNGVSSVRAQFSSGLQVLMGGVSLFLLLACANVAGLLLTRSTRRAEEIRLRLAMGATRGRLVRQLMTEGLLLGILGALGGIALSQAVLPLLSVLLPATRDRSAVLQRLAIHVAVDGRVLGFAVAVTFATVLLFALTPAVASVRSTELANGLRGSRSTRSSRRPTSMIVAGQVAVCTVILLGAVALIESFDALRRMNPGFDRDRVVTFTVDPALKGYNPEQSRALSATLLQTTRGLPGVAAASLASRGVMRGTGVKATLAPAGTRVTPRDFLNCSLNQVSEGYFEAMGMRVIAGRDFRASDQNVGTARSIAVVNQTFASRFYPGRDPIGERFGSPGPGNVAKAGTEIIGVVSDAKYRSLREPIPPTVYGLASKGMDSVFTLNVRTAQEPDTLVSPVRELLRSLDPELPFVEVQTLRHEVEASLWQERLLAFVATFFGVFSVVIAAIGLYGSLNYSVQARTREIGIRVAVGASPGRVAHLLGTEVFGVLAAGLAAGLAVYLGCAVFIRPALFGVKEWDMGRVAAVFASITGIAAAAVAPAVIRALRIDVATSLRTE